MHFTTLLSLSLATITTAIPTLHAPGLIVRQATNTTSPFCYQKPPGIYSPSSNAILTQDISSYTCNNFTLLYCSGQYFKTSSLSTSVGLSPSSNGININSGELLAKDVKADNADAQAGFYSYRYNVTICPVEGEYMTGPYALSVFETETGELIRMMVRKDGADEAGYYNALNYNVYTVNVTLATEGATCDGTGPHAC